MTEARSATIRVERTARYFLSESDGEQVVDLWFVLHGYGQLAKDFLSQFDGIRQPGRLVVAPEALSRFYTGRSYDVPGASWMTREFRQAEIDDYVTYLDAVEADVRATHAVASLRTTVLGFSQGSSTAARWLSYGFARADRLICWAGDIPDDLPPGSLDAVDITMVLGSNDHLLTPERVQTVHRRIAAMGLNPRVITFDGGHRMDEETLKGLTPNR